MAISKKKKTTIAAVATAAVLLLGGTFAWQSISQTALNEASDVVNPGGRLHDDFNGENKDVYIENFADDEIFARVKIDEYFEIVMNQGTDAEARDVIVGSYDGATGEKTGKTYIFDASEETKEYWTWTTGGSKIFMPTFNKNKDSLVADINGTYANDYQDYVVYEDGETLEGTEIYDADSNQVDEVVEGTAVIDENYKEVTATHTAKATGDATLISMAEWMALSEDKQIGAYWVYDTDGWVYWAQPIAAGEATGLLLDGIKLNQVMDDSWYYSINVTAQFITAEDLGKDDNSGFYDPNGGPTPSDNALALLKTIGVDTGNSENQPDDVTVVPDPAFISSIKNTEAGSTETVEISDYDFYVLAKEEEKALIMMAGYGISGNAFDNETNVWRDSNIRTYLNDQWLGTTELKDYALTTDIYTRESTESTDFIVTKDRVFLVSETDIFGTFNKNEENVFDNDYTYNNTKLPMPGGALDGSDFNNSMFFRSPYGDMGIGAMNGYYINMGGSIDYKGCCYPLLWVSLNGPVSE